MFQIAVRCRAVQRQWGLGLPSLRVGLCFFYFRGRRPASARPVDSVNIYLPVAGGAADGTGNPSPTVVFSVRFRCPFSHPKCGRLVPHFELSAYGQHRCGHVGASVGLYRRTYQVLECVCYNRSPTQDIFPPPNRRNARCTAQLLLFSNWVAEG